MLPMGKTAVHLDHDVSDPAAPTISFDQFFAVDIRIGHHRQSRAVPGSAQASLQAVDRFRADARDKAVERPNCRPPEELVGQQVAGVVNFPPRQIGKFMSEVLTVGFPDQNGAVVLFSPDRPVPNGARLF